MRVMLCEVRCIEGLVGMGIHAGIKDTAKGCRNGTSEIGLYSIAATVASGVALITGAFQTVFNFVLIPCLGKEGAAISRFVGYISGNVYLYIASQKNYFISYKLKDAFICFGFSWILIGMDRIFIPTWGITAFLTRVGMCLLFIPHAFWVGILRTSDVIEFFLSQRGQK